MGRSRRRPCHRRPLHRPHHLLHCHGHAYPHRHLHPRSHRLQHRPASIRAVAYKLPARVTAIVTPCTVIRFRTTSIVPRTRKAASVGSAGSGKQVRVLQLAPVLVAPCRTATRMVVVVPAAAIDNAVRRRHRRRPRRRRHHHHYHHRRHRFHHRRHHRRRRRPRRRPTPSRARPP